MLVALVTKECHHCQLLINNWDAIVSSVLSIYPSLTFPHAVEETKLLTHPYIIVKNNSIDRTYPPLMRYLRNHVIDQWYPMILLIDKVEWATNNITNPIIMNSKQINDKYILSINYDTRVIDQFKKWLQDVLNLTPVEKEKELSNAVCKNVLNLISIY